MQDSVHLQTVLALFEQENIRNNEQPSSSRLKTSVTCHTDQTMRTRNFRARNEIVKRGAVPKSHKGKKASAERKVGECYHWKANGQCSKGDSCSFRHDPASANRCAEGQKKNKRPTLYQRRRHRPTERYPPKVQVAEGRAPLGQEAELRAEIPLEESVRISHEFLGTLRCVLITSLNQDANMATNVDTDTLRLMGSPEKKRKVV